MAKLRESFKFNVKELKKDKEQDKKMVQWIDLIHVNSGEQ